MDHAPEEKLEQRSPEPGSSPSASSVPEGALSAPSGIGLRDPQKAARGLCWYRLHLGTKVGWMTVVTHLAARKSPARRDFESSNSDLCRDHADGPAPLDELVSICFECFQIGRFPPLLESAAGARADARSQEPGDRSVSVLLRVVPEGALSAPSGIGCGSQKTTTIRRQIDRRVSISLALPVPRMSEAGL